MSRASPRFKRINPPLPAVLPANGVVLYRIVGSLEGQLTVGTFYLTAPVPAPTQAQLTTLLTNCGTALLGKYGACISADWSLTQERIDVVHVNNIMGQTSTAHVPTVGARPATHLPTEVAGIILRNTAVKGQHGRGRLTVPGISPGDVTASRVTLAAALVQFNALAAAMVGVVSDGANNWSLCIAQRSTASPRLVVGASPITAGVFNPLLGTVRRRKIGRGK